MQLQMYWEVQYMNMHDYLMTVSEQIRCQRAWPMIEKELRDHIEDQKIDCMAEGMTEKEAEEEAVRQMGDPEETGMSLNHIHRPRMDWKLLAVAFLLAAVGLLLQWMTYQQPDSAYKAAEVWRQVRYSAAGFVIMILLCFMDYSLIGRYAGRIWLAVLGLEVFTYAVNVMWYRGIWINGGIYSYGALIDCLLLPAFAGMLWSRRGSKEKGIAKSAGWLLVIGILFLLPFQNHIYAPVVFGICGTMLCVTVWKGWFFQKQNQKKDKKQIRILLGLILLTAVGALLLAWYTGNHFIPMEYSQTVRENVQSLAAMDKAGVDLTGSELEWTRFDVRGDFLWLYLFYRFGMAPVTLLTVLAVLFLVFLFLAVFRQKNRLGFLIGLGCVSFVAVQIIWYLGSNLGLLPSGQGYMPFCTIGGTNMTVTYIYTGLLLSVYRNSRVVKN